MFLRKNRAAVVFEYILFSGETCLLFYRLINFAPYDVVFSLSNNISHLFLLRLTYDYKRNLETFSSALSKNIIGDLSIMGEYILITFCSSPTLRKLNIFPTRSLRIIVALKLHLLVLLAYVFRSELIFVAQV